MLDRKYFKTDRAFIRQDLLCAQAKTVLAAFIRYAKEIGVAEPIITETVTTLAEDLEVNRAHDQHRRRVAFDARVNDWAGEQIDAMLDKLNADFLPLAYVTSSGEKRVAFCHDNGNGMHFHVAVNAIYKLEEYTNKP